MGKYMKKAKKTGEVARMDSSLGVRTRAKTLALQQRLQNSPAPANSTGAGAFLQLRSRRLEKQVLIGDSKRQKPTPKESSLSKTNPIPNPNPSLASKEGICLESEEKNLEKRSNDVEEGTEASFGDNVLEFEGKERSTRESTPCSLIRDPESIRTPGSTTRPTMSAEANRGLLNSVPIRIPRANQIDAFFAGFEAQQCQQFIERYNFDPATDTPLPGRYEWTKLDP
ncbi:hypothetical protein Vadar_005629 [Vaccinium darrowii]|uniref:Uncharacterized protein n=1 Tax=Vaccinium darrowii TaxID=229202 RepID=A0ACB7WY69_9ERIC|nr:hypothetical protein Vadar_005629 [Vaccinium darrowii]